METKTCPTCKVTQPVSSYYKARKTGDGLNWQCKTCHKERMHKQFVRNAERTDVVTFDGVKTCSTCKQTKPKADFNRNRSTATGIHYECRECEKAGRVSAIAKNIATNNGRRKEFGAEHLKKCTSCKEHKPAAEFTNDMTRYDGLKTTCKTCSSELSKQWRSNNLAKALFKSAKYGAKKRGIEFAITVDDIQIPDRCPIFGFKMEFGGKRSTSPSIDRIDNSKGYVPGNIVVVSVKANHVKSDCTLAELHKLVDFYDSLK